NCFAQAPAEEQQPPAIPQAADGTYPAVDSPMPGPSEDNGTPASAHQQPPSPTGKSQVGAAGVDEFAGAPGIDESADADPFQKFNESMFTFNRKLDQYVLRPVAGGYAKVLPLSAR